MWPLGMDGWTTDWNTHIILYTVQLSSIRGFILDNGQTQISNAPIRVWTSVCKYAIAIHTIAHKLCCFVFLLDTLAIGEWF